MKVNEPFDLESYIMKHILDGHEWHIPFLPPIHLPHFLSLHMVMVLFAAFLLILTFIFLYRKKDPVPTGLTNALEAVIIFIRDQISIAYLGKEDGRRFTPFFCTLFFFILILNLIGQIPLFVVATANINVTGALAFIILTCMIGGTILRSGVSGFVDAIVPKGVPWPILIFLVPLEFLGVFIKSFALMIRLFANMFAGHIVILSLLGLIIILGIAALPAVLLAVFVSVLELGIAFLQAYIFTMLAAVFMGQMYHPEH